MRHKWNGFTFIEISMFIAISGLLFVGVIGMSSLAISQQRFNDATQNFAEFLRSVYAGVENPQGIGDGRSEKVIYGKLVTFGESVALDGSDTYDTQKIFVYDVVGNDYDYKAEASDLKAMIGTLKMDVILLQKSGVSDVVVRAGIVESYTPRWSAVIDSTENGVPFKGSLLIIRNPRTGIITTLVAEGGDGVVQVNEKLRNDVASMVNFVNSGDSLLVNKLSYFKDEKVDFCVNMEGYGNASSRRQDVRLSVNAKNVSEVSIVEMDGAGNSCK